MKPIFAQFTDQSTLVLSPEQELDDNPIAVLYGGCIGPLFNTAKAIPTEEERRAFWWGVVAGLRHGQNVLHNQDLLGMNEFEWSCDGVERDEQPSTAV